MRFLHLADLHIGRKVNEFPMIDDQRFALQQIVNLLKTSKPAIDAVLIAGDLYDKPTPSAEAVALVDWFLTQVAAAETACFVIPGNHDSAERVGYAQHLLAKQNVHVAGTFSGSIPHIRMQDEFGPIVFWLLPFVRPAAVRDYYPDEEIGTDYTRAIDAAIKHEGVDFSERNVILAHQFVSFGNSKPETSDSELASVGGLDEVNSAVFDGFDYVALGHIHKSQSIGAPHMRYAGSLLKYSFSEANHKKRLPLVTLNQKGDIQVEFMTINPLHDLREISGPLEELTKPAVVAAAPADDYLHVTLTDEHPIVDALAQLRTVYPNIMTLDYRAALDRSTTQSTLENGVSNLDFNPEELFREFYGKQFGSPLTDLQDKTFTTALRTCLDISANGSNNEALNVSGAALSESDEEHAGEYDAETNASVDGASIAAKNSKEVE